MDITSIFTTFPVLETARCTLREAQSYDLQAIFDILSDPQVTRYLGRPPMTSLDDAERRLQIYRTTYEDQTGIPWCIVDRASGQVFGTCVLWQLDLGNFRAALGYTLHKAWWGRGLATEAAEAALAFGFNRLGLHSIEAQTDPGNAASQRVLHKLGFVQEGYFRENYYDMASGTFTDTVVFSLLKSTWLSRTGGSP